MPPIMQINTYLSPYCFISHNSSLFSSTHDSVTWGSVLWGVSSRFLLRKPLLIEVTSTREIKEYHVITCVQQKPKGKVSLKNFAKPWKKFKKLI